MTFIDSFILPADAAAAADLPACDAEPIHVPSAIQPPGCLLVVRNSDLTVLQISDNATAVLSSAILLHRPLAEVLPPAVVDRVIACVRSGLGHTPVPIPAGAFDLLIHRQGELLILETEPAAGTDDDLYRVVGTGFPSLAFAGSVEQLSAAASSVVRNLTGFDRVMVYRFDADFNGQVVGESLAAGVDPWLGLRYPASDIPSQARAMYVRSRTRVVADVGYAPVPVAPAVNPDTGLPVDLTHAAHRSVSPVHLEYLRNMGVGASMSVSVVLGDRLWGMILCHHPTPRPVGYRVRIACDVLAQNLALHLSMREFSADAAVASELKSLQPKLLEAMAGAARFEDGLRDRADELLRLGGGTGVAVVADRTVTAGVVPTEPQVAAVVDWLSAAVSNEVFATDSLAAAFPPAVDFKAIASGLLAVRVSGQRKWYVLWFRPEVFHARYWAGDPRKSVEVTAYGQVVRPRSDFQRWKQTLELHCTPWESAHVAAVTEFRNAAVGIVLKQAEERARLTTELERANEELEAFSYTVSHDLRAPFRHITGFADLLQRHNPNLDPTSQRYIETITGAAHFAGKLVDGLLNFSQTGRSALRPVPVDLAAMVSAVRAEVTAEAEGRRIEWVVDPLPPVSADPVLIQVVVRNLLANAVKYTRRKPVAHISIVCRGPEPIDTDGLALIRFEVSDDGAGFDMKYAEKLFGVFQRLHKDDEYEGTGIGLANVRRIVERHGGRVWAAGAVDAGATFTFTLPSADGGGAS